MDKRCPPCATVEVLSVQSCISTPVGLPIPTPPKQVCSKCNNLLQNPSFETGLTGWEWNNVIAADYNPFEGTQVARMGPGVASLFQDVSLVGLEQCPLFLSFEAFPYGDAEANGNLVVEVIWLDAADNPVATGLCLFSPEGTINPDGRVTYFAITDRPPKGAVSARLQFSKGAGADNAIEIDQVILAPVNTINLVKNPSFELGLTNWNATGFTPGFGRQPTYRIPFEGNAFVVTEADGTLSQDIPISQFPAQSSFMLSFATFGRNATLSVKVLWLDASNMLLGTGLDLFITDAVFGFINTYLTYVDVTAPAPAGAVKARILFTADILSDTSLLLDQVIFTRAGSANLVQNPSFASGLTNWNSLNTTASTDVPYEGTLAAQIGANGGFLFQDVPLANAVGHCFLLNFGLGFRRAEVPAFTGDLLAKVHWLDASGQEIGLGLSLVIPGFTPQTNLWSVYAGITEPIPSGTVAARIQFTKSEGGTSGVIDVDKVVFARLV